MGKLFLHARIHWVLQWMGTARFASPGFCKGVCTKKSVVARLFLKKKTFFFQCCSGFLLPLKRGASGLADQTFSRLAIRDPAVAWCDVRSELLLRRGSGGSARVARCSNSCSRLSAGANSQRLGGGRIRGAAPLRRQHEFTFLFSGCAVLVQKDSSFTFPPDRLVGNGIRIPIKAPRCEPVAPIKGLENRAHTKRSR